MRELTRRKTEFIARTAILIICILGAVWFCHFDIESQAQTPKNLTEALKTIDTQSKAIADLNAQLQKEQAKNESRMPKTGEKFAPTKGYVYVQNISVTNDIATGRVVNETDDFYIGDWIYCDKRYLVEIQLDGKPYGFMPVDKILFRRTP
jgi:hypothetical protein